MTPAWPRTLVGRSILVLFAAVLISNALGLAAYLGERWTQQTGARERAIAERVAVAARLLDDAPPAERHRHLRSLRGGGLRLQWADELMIQQSTTVRRVGSLRKAFVEELALDPGDGLRLALTQPPLSAGAPDDDPPGRGIGGPGWGAGRGREHSARGAQPGALGTGVQVLQGALRLADGSWLNFAAPLGPVAPAWTSSMLLLIAATSLAAAGIAAVAVWRASTPLSMFAAAAERLGRDLESRPLDEAGPEEVARAARAFNGMQGRLQRMVRQRTQMLAAMSHDLRTPLTRLRLRAELLEDPVQQEKTLADLGQIEGLVSASLDFARDAFAGEPPARIDLAALVQTVCDEAADVGGPVRYRGPDRAPFVARPLALRRALTNLIDNAVRYGTRVEVSLTTAGGSGPAAIVVEDDGPGLPEAELDRVFEPFYRRDASRSRDGGGVGLGLAIVRAVAAAHGGAVSLANLPAKGLVATLSLPGGDLRD